jgi:hypothetical protein
LKPFLRFDQLAPLRLPGCEAFAIGIGVFGTEAHYKSRNRQLLSASGPDEFTATTLQTTLEETQALTLLLDQQGRPVVVSIGSSGGRSQIEASLLDSCNSLQVLAIGDIEFDWRTPSAPEEFTDPNLPHLGIKLQAFEVSPGVIRAIHYDGFTLRQLDINLESRTVFQQNVEL